jgi:hypothetical protein
MYDCEAEECEYAVGVYRGGKNLQRVRKAGNASSPGNSERVRKPGNASSPGNSGGKNRPGLPSPVQAVDGTFQLFESNLAGCQSGNYKVSGSFDSSFTTFTLTKAEGAEGCFASMPVQLFTAPGLIDGGPSINFESRVGPGSSPIVGSVSRIYGSFISPVAYPDASGETVGFLTLNSENTRVNGDIKNGVLNNLPISPSEKASEYFPELIPPGAKESEIIRDSRSDSETSGLEVVRNQVSVVFSPDTTVDEVNSALAAVGGAIIESYPGVSAVTIAIPDTDDLDGVDRAKAILSTQPRVVTTIPVIIPPIPEPPETQLSLSSSSTSPEQIPMPLQLVGAVDKNGKRPASSGNGKVNLFVEDFFSDPMHGDLRLVNPAYNKSALMNQFEPYLGQNWTNQNITLHKQEKVLEIKSQVPLLSHPFKQQPQLFAETLFCKVTGYFCPQTISVGLLDSDNNQNVAFFANNEQDQKDEKLKIKHDHGLSTGQKSQNIEKLITFLLQVKDNRPQVVKPVTE